MVNRYINKPYLSKLIIMVNRIKLLKELEKYPVFGVQVISNIANKSRNYSWLYLYRLKKAKLIFELERDKYTLHSDPLLIASHVIWPCYISSWSAIRYYNLTEQLPTYIQVITTRSKKRRLLEFGNAKIEFARIKKENFFGFGKIPYGDFEIFMAEKEKALADALYLNQISFETFTEILQEYRKELNMKKLAKYLKQMKMNGVIRKLRGAKTNDNKK